VPLPSSVETPMINFVTTVAAMKSNDVKLTGLDCSDAKITGREAVSSWQRT
jgi:hypothetical protein